MSIRETRAGLCGIGIVLVLACGTGCTPAPAAQPLTPSPTVAAVATPLTCDSLDEGLQQLSQAADAAAWAAQSGIPLDDGRVMVRLALCEGIDGPPTAAFPQVQFGPVEAGEVLARVPVDELCALAQHPEVAQVHLYTP